MLIRDLAEHYLTAYEFRTKRATQAQVLKPVLKHFGAMDIDTLSQGDIHEYQRQRRKRNGDLVSSGTLCRELTALRTVLNYAVRTGEIPAAAVPYIWLPQTPPPRTVTLTAPEEQALLDLAARTSNGLSYPTRIHRFVQLALKTGARMSAILQLRWSQVDFDAKTIDYRDDRPLTRKRRVVVPMTRHLPAWLHWAHAGRSSDYVLDHSGSIYYDWRQLIQGTEFSHLRIHDLRRTFATLLAQSGADMWAIAGLLGDSLETVTRHYAHHSPDYLRAAIDTRSTS